MIIYLSLPFPFSWLLSILIFFSHSLANLANMLITCICGVISPVGISVESYRLGLHVSYICIMSLDISSIMFVKYVDVSSSGSTSSFIFFFVLGSGFLDVLIVT